MSQNAFDSAVKSYQAALDAFLKGDPKPVQEHFSQRDDVTLANPLGPPRLGRAEVEKAIAQAAANFEDGHMHFEEISRFHTDDLGYVIWLERGEVRLAEREAMAPSSLRVTMIFRREGATWKSYTATPTQSPPTDPPAPSSIRSRVIATRSGKREEITSRSANPPPLASARSSIDARLGGLGERPAEWWGLRYWRGPP